MNTAYFSSLVNRANAVAAEINSYTAKTQLVVATVSSCSALAALAERVAVQLAADALESTDIATQSNAAIADIQSGISASLAVLAALQTAPTNLTQLITWATAVTSTYVAPYTATLANQTTVVAQAALVAAALTNLATAVENATNTLNSAIAAKKTSLGCS